MQDQQGLMSSSRRVGRGGPGAAHAAQAASQDRDRLVALATLTAEAVLGELHSSAQGLGEGEVLSRQRQYGPNAIAQETMAALPLALLQKLVNPLNILLLVLSLVSLVTGGLDSAIVISLMVVLSVTLSLVQERRSGRAAAALRAMVHTTATVLRAEPGAAAALREVPLEQLVPGDVVRLSAGDMVPADVRLLAAKDLYVNQSSLTGESMPAAKEALQEGKATDPLQLRNTCFMGTSVASGSATALVIHTGAHAVFGGIASAVTGEHALTDFDRGIRRFTWLMIRFMAVMVPIVFVVNGVTKGNWLEALLFATAVAVGLTPEMLPMLVTVNLSKGALAMSRKKVIVKQLSAIQNFGAMDVLCTDKTGTLTQDRIILEKYEDLFGNASDRVLEYAYLNSYHQSGLKNLLDLAVLRYTEVHEKLQASGAYTKIDEAPFDFQRRRMSVVVEGQGERLLICKGAVEEIFAVCTQGERGEETFALDAGHLAQLQSQTAALNADGFRVIAIAYRRLPSEARAYGAADEAQLTLLGYIAFLDPPKDSAREAIAALAAHGIKVKILTGDNDIVTRKICRDVGLGVDEVVLGSELEKLGPEALCDAAERAQVFAKLSPGQKAQVIQALQRRSHVVGYMGDGINDAPALRAADVGVTVDTAVDIAKESADIVLLEKSLLVLDDGVIEGRKVFGNLLKYIRMGASSNFGNMFSVLGASAWLPFLPMAPIQVLANNLMYDFSQTAIPTDNIDEEYLATPRRWQIGHIARYMMFIGPISSVFDYTTFLLMYYVFAANTNASAALFQTGWFVESLLSQTLIIHVIRTNRVPFLQSRASAALCATGGIICAVGVLLPYTRLGSWFGFVPLPWLYWPAVGLTLLAYLVLTFVMKRWYLRRFGLT